MNNHSSNDSSRQTLSFFQLASNGGEGNSVVSILKSAVSRLVSTGSQQIVHSPHSAGWATVARPIIPRRVVSRYKVDDFGQPRIVSEREASLRFLTLSIMVGIALGFALAIFLLDAKNASMLQVQEKASAPQSESQETAS